MEGPNVITDHIINLVRPPDVRSVARDQDIILREDTNGGQKEVSTHEKRYHSAQGAGLSFLKTLSVAETLVFSTEAG